MTLGFHRFALIFYYYFSVWKSASNGNASENGKATEKAKFTGNWQFLSSGSIFGLFFCCCSMLLLFFINTSSLFMNMSDHLQTDKQIKCCMDGNDACPCKLHYIELINATATANSFAYTPHSHH